MKIGDKIYKIDWYGKYLRTITYIGKDTIEWKYGYALKSQIKENTDKKSKVKYIVNYTK
jgi:hypothetical protein